MRKLTRILLMLMAFGGLLISTSCASQAPKPPLKVGWVLWPGWFPLVIAQEKGFFKEQGVGVELTFSESSLTSEFSAKKIDGLAGVVTHALNLNAQGDDTRIILVTDISMGADAIVAQPDIQQVSDLKGKNVGVNFGQYGELLLRAMLQANDLTRNQINLIDVNGDEVLPRLQDGTIQAGVIWEPLTTQAKKANYKVIFDSSQTPGLVPDVITFHQSVLKERPDDVRAFTRAWFQAVDFWLANPDEGNAIVMRVLKLPQDEVSLNGLKLLTLKDNLQMFERDDTTASIYHTTQLYADFLIETGAVTKAPDLDKVLDSSFLPLK